MMKLHGGSLLLSSTVGSGTVVTVHIPHSRIVVAHRQQAAG
jgi:signal transduction histidine kinase